MATHTYAVVSEDGNISLPVKLRKKMKLHAGTRLEVVSDNAEHLVLQAEKQRPSQTEMEAALTSMRGFLASPKVEIHLPKDLEQNPMALQGFLKDIDCDPNAMLAAERAWELARDEWQYGPYPKR